MPTLLPPPPFVSATDCAAAAAVGGAAGAPLKKMSLTPEWRTLLHQPQAEVAARTLLASTHACDQRLQDYANDLCWWRQRHESAIEQLARINRAAVEALTREERRVQEARERLHWEMKEAEVMEVLREGVEGMEVRQGDQEQVWEPPAAPSVARRFQVPRDTALAIASSKVRRANKLATEAINREHRDVFATLFAPDCSHGKPWSSLSSPGPLYHPLRPPADGGSAELKAAQLLSMAAAVRGAVVAGSVYAIQTRNLDGERETLRCGRLTLSRGHLHLHCLAEGPPPPGSITIEHKEALNELVDREGTLVFLDVENTSPRLRGRVYIRFCPDTGRGRQFTWLCTGQRGVSYTNTRVLGVLDKGEPKERIIAGDYEGTDGAGGASLIPWLGWGREYRREWRAGVVRGWWGGIHRAAQFFITTQHGNPGETVHFAFGQVERGLEVVREVAALPDPSQARVVDCGVVLVEEVESAAVLGEEDGV